MRFFKRVMIYFLLVCFVIGNDYTAIAQSIPGATGLPRAGNNLQTYNLQDAICVHGKSFGGKTIQQYEQLCGKGLPDGEVVPPKGDAILNSNKNDKDFQGSGELNQVHILGEVGYPGTYRVSASTRLFEALKLADGVAPQGTQRRVQLRRVGVKNQEVDLLLFGQFGSLENNPYLIDNDIIFVPLAQRIVQIEGAVKKPAIYDLKDERTLEDIVILAGGFTPGGTSPLPIKVIRYLEGKREIIDIDNRKEARSEFQIRNGDIIIVSHFLTTKKKFDYNVGQIPGDQGLFYPSYEERIFVIGAVVHPGPYAYSPYYNGERYVSLAGGPTKLAKKRRILVVSSDGQRRKMGKYSEIDPGDTIVVPERYMGPESLITLALGLVGTTLGITTTFIALSR